MDFQKGEYSEKTIATEIQGKKPIPWLKIYAAVAIIIIAISSYAFIGGGLIFSTPQINPDVGTPASNTTWEKHHIIVLCNNGSDCRTMGERLYNMSEVVWFPFNGNQSQTIVLRLSNETEVEYPINVTEVPYYFDITRPSNYIYPGLRTREEIVNEVMIEYIEMKYDQYIPTK